MHKEQLQIPIIKPSSNLAPVTSVTTTDRPRTSQRAPSKPKGHLQKNLLFPLESAPSKHVPPFLHGMYKHMSGKVNRKRKIRKKIRIKASKLVIRHHGQLQQRKIPQGNKSIKYPECLGGFGSQREYGSSFQKQLPEHNDQIKLCCPKVVSRLT